MWTTLMRISKQGSQPLPLAFARDSKADRGVGKLYFIVKKGKKLIGGC